MSILISAVSFLVALAAFLRTLRTDKVNRAWEDYRDTVYDDLKDAVNNLSFVAHPKTAGQRITSAEDLETYERDLSRALNSLSVQCTKADHHPRSKRKNWEEHCDAAADALAETGRLYRENALSLENALGNMTRDCMSCCRTLEREMREQREAMQPMATLSKMSKHLPDWFS